MSTMNSEVYDALVDAGADEAKAREAAKSVARYDNDVAEIKASLLPLEWNKAVPRPSTALVGATAIPLRGIAKRPRQRSPLEWMVGFTLAFVVAVAWRTFA